MKRRFGIAIALFCAMLASAMSRNVSDSAAQKEVLIVDDMFVGTWVGFGSAAIYKFRLDLRSDKTGMLGWIFLQEKASLYYVKQWHFSDGKLEMRIEPTCEDSEPLVVTANTDAGQIELIISDARNKWKESGLLVPETMLEPAWINLKKAVSSGWRKFEEQTK